MNLKNLTLMNDEADQNNSFLEIHAGAGGTESQDWAEMLQRMYVRWAEGKEFDIFLLYHFIKDRKSVPRLYYYHLMAHNFPKNL